MPKTAGNIEKANESEVFDVESEENILKANEKLAHENKELLKKHGVTATDVMGSIGAAKTSLIEKLVELLEKRYNIAIFKGDLTTTIDAGIIKSHAFEVVAINTEKECARVHN